MSLYIGNLSARTRKDELERVFQRYGQCDVRLKDGYGFVVYDFPPDAESALSALRGRNIRGRQLTISWSNKQPRTFQRHARDARSYESHGRDSSSRKNSNDWRERDFRSGFEQPNNDGGRLNSEDMLDEGRDYHQENMIDNDYIGEEHRDIRRDLPRDDGDVGTKLVDNGRWGEQVDDLFADKDGMAFDHYEPDKGYDRKDRDENRWRESSGGSALGSSQDNVGRERDGDRVLKRPSHLKFQQNCYGCGALGHKMRDCPRKHSSRRKFTRFEHSQDDDIEKSRGGGELEGFRSKSRGNMRSTRLRHKNDKWTSDSGQLRMSVKNGNSSDTDRVRGKEHGVKKRSKRETRSPKRHSAKKSKRLASPSFHSEYTASRLHSTSKSSKSLTSSISRFRSRSVSAAGSLSSTSRSRSKSRYSESRSSKSRSRSSSPTSLSLSVSLGRPASSPSKPQLNRKESVDKGTTPESRDIQGQYSKNTKVATEMAAVNGGNAVSASEVEDDKGKNQHLLRDENTMSRSSLHVMSPGTSLPEIGAIVTEHSPQEVSRDRTNFDALAMGHMARPTTMSNSETPRGICSDHKPSISLEEMCMALKHYGVEVPEESEKHTSLEAFFGSARLWPWESIYYRRVKKGPISVENYARRIAQNQEFGIVDKYIRSSSGWGEIYLDNP